MTMVNKIEAWRIRWGLSKKALAERLGVSYPYLVNLLNGKAKLTDALAFKMEQLTKESRPKYGLEEVVAFAVKMTPEEYALLCKKVGAEHLTAEQCEQAVRELLQKAFDELAESAPQVVDLSAREFRVDGVEAAEDEQ